MTADSEAPNLPGACGRLRGGETLWWFAVFAAGAALWLLNHPYGGIWHDARIYTLMAVHWLDPTPFVSDPWFSGKSVDGLSIFTPIYGALISLSGISLAAMLMTLLGALGWLLATGWLSFSWFGRPLAVLVFLFLSSIPLTYCLGRPIFIVSESFVTARLLAISFSIAGIVAATNGRFRTGMGLQVIGMLFHPLMALWGLLATVCLKMPDRGIVTMAAFSLACVSVLSLNPMDMTALRMMDPEWQEVVKASAMVVFLEPWPKIAINDALWWLSILLFAGEFGQVKPRRLYQIVSLISALALLLSLIASYFLPIVFFLQAQFWRALWLAVLIGCVAALDVGWTAVRSGRAGRGIAVMLALTLLFRDAGGGLALFLAYGIWSVDKGHLLNAVASKQEAVIKTAGFLVLLAVAVCLPDILMEIWIIGGMDRASALGLIENMLIRATPFFFYAVVPLAVWFCMARLGDNRRYRWGMALGAGLLLSFAAWHWDQRLPAKQQIEARYRVGGNRDLFAGLVRPGQQVYWPGNALRVWFDLGTASYASSVQAIGIVFSRERMVEVRRRLERIVLMEHRPQTDQDAHQMAVRYVSEQGWLNTSPLDLHTYEESSSLTKEGLSVLCSDPVLDFVVSERFFPSWSVAQHMETVRQRNIAHYLYDCDKFRSRNMSDGETVLAGPDKTELAQNAPTIISSSFIK